MKDKLKELSLEPEMIDKIETILKEHVTNAYIPKNRFDEVVEQKNKFQADIAARDAQLEALKTSTGDIDKLKKQIETLQADNQKAQDEYNAKIKAMRRDDFINTKLREAGLLDDKYIPGIKAYLSVDKLDIDNVSSVEAFDAELATAKSIASSWFKTNEPPSKEIGGLKLSDPKNKVDPSIDSLPKDSYEYILAKFTN